MKNAADNGLVDAMNNYACMLEAGDGVAVDKKEASEYVKKAADKGSASSMFNYGKMLKNGDGIPKSIKEAMKYLIKAFDNGYKEAIMLELNK